jgi:transcriptional regulator with PAS, ATPase and Fis domain
MEGLSVNQNELLDLLPLGICVINRNGSVCAWNATLADWTGIPQQEATGMNLAERFPHLSSWCYRDRLAQVFTSGTPAIFSAAFHRIFIPATATFGATQCQMIQQTTVRPLGPSREHALVVIQDVTGQYLQMEELRAERLRLARRGDSMPVQAAGRC